MCQSTEWRWVRLNGSGANSVGYRIELCKPCEKELDIGARNAPCKVL